MDRRLVKSIILHAIDLKIIHEGTMRDQQGRPLKFYYFKNEENNENRDSKNT